MRYRQYIEDNFLIDEPKNGQLIPFKFNQVQEKYYQQLCELGLETLGINAALREFIVKARREGFSSLILALFAADDLLQSNPTESAVVSYKEDATQTFRKRYRRYILSTAAKKSGVGVEQIQADPNLLEQFAKACFSVDAADLELKHNRAHFYCGTAASRTGGRGGVLQKLLFSEAAHYQDTEKMTAKEIIEGTAQQVDKESGWIFQESTANGVGNYFYSTYETIKTGLSRYKLRFYGWREFYTEEQFKVVASEFTDADMLKQEYPETIEEAFLSSNLSYTNREALLALVGFRTDKTLITHLDFVGENYIDQCEMIKDWLVTLIKTNPNRNFYVGIDSGKITDHTIVTILKENELSSNGGIKAIAIDATGAGDFMPDWFEKNTKWYIHRVKFSRGTKSVMYKNLQVVINEKLTTLPVFLVEKEFASEEWKRWYKQTIGLQKQIIGEMMVVGHPPGSCNSSHDYDTCSHHDDYPDSWALAELAYVVVKGVPEGHRPPEEKTNFDSAVRRLLNQKGHGGAGQDDF